MTVYAIEVSPLKIVREVHSGSTRTQRRQQRMLGLKHLYKELEGEPQREKKNSVGRGSILDRGHST